MPVFNAFSMLVLVKFRVAVVVTMVTRILSLYSFII